MSAGERPSSASTASVSAPGQGGGRSSVDGVRSNRGAGADCGTPPADGTCRGRPGAGAAAASSQSSTGATQASLPANTSAHSSRVRVANSSAQRCFAAGQPAGSSRRSGGPRRHRPFRTVAAARRRTSAPARRPRSPGRRRRCRPRRTARRCRAGCARPAPTSRRRCAGRARSWPAPPYRPRWPRRPPGPARCGRPNSNALTTPKASIIPPPPMSPSRFIGGTGRLAGPARPVQRAGDRDVADVVAGHRREWTVLAPAGHPPVHQRGVDRVAVGRAEPEPLGDAGPEALQQRVRPGDQVEHDLPAVGVLEVDGDRPAAAQHDVGVRAGRVRAHVAGALDPDHVRADVGEHHRGERAGTDPGQLHHPHACQRTAHASRIVSAPSPQAARPRLPTHWRRGPTPRRRPAALAGSTDTTPVSADPSALPDAAWTPSTSTANGETRPRRTAARPRRARSAPAWPRRSARPRTGTPRRAPSAARPRRPD